MTTEHAEQVTLFDWAALPHLHPDLALLYAIPNGGHRHIRVARRMKDEGVKAGVPDIHLPVARGGYHGLWIEMKVGSNKPTTKQREWIVALREQGHRVEVCYGFEEAREVILEYLEDNNDT